MEDGGQETGSQQNSAGTGENVETAATQQNENSEAATQGQSSEQQKPETKQLTSEEISARDRKNEQNRQLEARTERLENFAVDRMLRDDIAEYLSKEEIAEKYPDVQESDLLDAESPKDFDKLAQQTQARIDESVQRRLNDIERTQPPKLTPEQKAAQEKALKEKPGVGSLEKHIEMQSA